MALLLKLEMNIFSLLIECGSHFLKQNNVFHNSFVEIEFTYHTILPLKVSNLVVFRMFEELYRHLCEHTKPLSIIYEHFHFHNITFLKKIYVFILD